MNSENILGYQVSSSEDREIIDTVFDWLMKNEKRKYLVCANPHSLVVSEKDESFRDAIRAADLVVPDGAGIVLASKVLGGKIRHRVTGTDIFLGLNERINAAGGLSCYFLGSDAETLKKISTRMAADFPAVSIAGTYSPPYKVQFDAKDVEAMIDAVNHQQPDVLWVGMTAPKQEKWVYENRSRLNVGFIGPVGAVFDFYAGNVIRSHPFFQKIGMEWLPRLLREPRRLWRRNLISSPLFLTRVLLQRLGKS